MHERTDSLRPVWVGAAIGLLAAIGFLSGMFGSWSSRATDRFFLPHAYDPSITIVAIDDASLGKIGRWPWPRRVHADLIKKLSDAGATVIGYDVNFPEVSTKEDDDALAAALKSAGNVVLPVELQLQTIKGSLSFDPKTVVSPISLIASSAKATGHSNTPPDPDGIVRGVPLSVRAPDGSAVSSFAGEVARLSESQTQLEQAPVDTSDRVLVNFLNRPFASFRTISAGDVIRGTADLSAIKGGVVFVGSTAADLHDALLVPTSDGLPMSGVEIHASLFDTLKSGRWLRPIPSIFVALLILLLGAIVGFVVSRIRARWSILAVIGAWIALLIASFVLFDRGWILDVMWPTFALLFAYAGVTLERRVSADRQRKQLKSALSRYVSPSVVESILKDPSKLKLGGERRRMSVLFSDIRGFTTISEGISPEELVRILNIYLNRMTNIVFDQSGVLDKYIGDAVMAFWNAPFDQADHAVLAVRTAIIMQQTLEEMNRAKAFGNLELHIGIGVNTGDMIVGNVGGDARFDYTVIGDNVNLASRLEGVTKEYAVRIIATEATKKEIGDAFQVRRLDKVAVKGKKEPVLIYEVMGESAGATFDQKQLAKEFEAALDAYFARNFTDALAKFSAILAKTPNDGPSKTFIERAKHFLENPPPSDWVGTWVYTKK